MIVHGRKYGSCGDLQLLCILYGMSPFLLVMFATTPTLVDKYGEMRSLYKNMNKGKESVRKALIMIV